MLIKKYKAICHYNLNNYFVYISLFLFILKNNVYEVKDINPEIQGNILDYIDNIKIEGLYIQKNQMDVAGIIQQGFGFSFHYTLPQVSHESDNPIIGLQIVYPEEYRTVIGTEMSPITYIKKSSINEQSLIYSFDAYPANISTENIDKLINTQYYFKINIYHNEIIIKDIYINQLTES